MRKSIREPRGSRSAHQITKSIVEKLPIALSKPLLIIDSPQKQGILVILDEKDYMKRNIAVAVHLKTEIYGTKVNEVKSIYGREGLENFLEREKDNIVYIDKQKAKQLSPTIVKQYHKAPITLDYNTNLPQNPSPVNQNKEKSPCLPRSPEEIAKNIQASGFRATAGLIHNVRKLDRLSGRDNTLKDICDTYKNNCDGLSKEETEIVREIAAECRRQEQQRPVEPLEPEP